MQFFFFFFKQGLAGALHIGTVLSVAQLDNRRHVFESRIERRDLDDIGERTRTPLAPLPAF